MFKKVKYNNGKRELYLFKKKIFEYVRQGQFADFVKKRLDNIANLTQNSTNLPLDTAKLVFDSQGGGGGSFYAFDFLLKRAYVAHKYHKIFYDFYLRASRGEELIFVDGGCHNGVFADVALACGGLCYAFEPNIYLCAFLRNLYKNNPKFILHEKAISTKNEKTIFYDESDICVVGQGGSVVQWDTNFDYHASQKRSGYEVQMIDFADFVKELVAKHGKINFVKLDIEGAEFEVLDALLEQNLHENIEYLMVETHERIFDNPKAKIQALKDKIKAKNITNIYLDWI